MQRLSNVARSLHGLPLSLVPSERERSADCVKLFLREHRITSGSTVADLDQVRHHAESALEGRPVVQRARIAIPLRASIPAAGQCRPGKPQLLEPSPRQLSK